MTAKGKRSGILDFLPNETKRGAASKCPKCDRPTLTRFEYATMTSWICDCGYTVDQTTRVKAQR